MSNIELRPSHRESVIFSIFCVTAVLVFVAPHLTKDVDWTHVLPWECRYEEWERFGAPRECDRGYMAAITQTTLPYDTQAKSICYLMPTENNGFCIAPYALPAAPFFRWIQKYWMKNTQVPIWSLAPIVSERRCQDLFFGLFFNSDEMAGLALFLCLLFLASLFVIIGDTLVGSLILVTGSDASVLPSPCTIYYGIENGLRRSSILYQTLSDSWLGPHCGRPPLVTLFLFLALLSIVCIHPLLLIAVRPHTPLPSLFSCCFLLFSMLLASVFSSCPRRVSIMLTLVVIMSILHGGS